MLRKILITLIILIIAVGTLYAIGPRVPVDTTVTFNSTSIGDDVDAYLAASEAAFDDIRDGLEKQVIWAYPASKAKTPLSIVYLHGFSSSKGETSPLSDIVARELGANLFYTRLTGHGRDGEAMTDATVNRWINDLAEAIAIGRKIGERVVIIGTSTGGALAAWGATEPTLLDDVAAMALISPNFGIQAAGASLLTLPWGGDLAELIAGKERSYEPQNELHRKYNTYSYPTRATLPLAAMTTLASAAPYETATIPALFIISDSDKVVMPLETRRIAQVWGADWKIIPVENSEDPYQHVLAGDALSPSTTGDVAAKIIAWVREISETGE